MPRRDDRRLANAHLFRRAAFGPTPAQAATLADRDEDALLDELLAGLDVAPPPAPEGFDTYVPGAIQRAWLERLASGHAPLAEMLALFWHGHFATSDAKLQDPLLLWRQMHLFRTQGGGRFRDLLGGVARDVAMVRWLDGNANRVGHPNENWGRELLELFTLGRGHYDETDVREVARAFTGWGSHGREFVYTAAHHDGGPKRVLGKTGRFDGDDVLDLLAASDRCHRFLAARLLRFFSHPDPTPAEVDALARVLHETDGSIRHALRALFEAPAFRAPANQRSIVRSPVAFVVAATRAVDRVPPPDWTAGRLVRMGQILFRPPSVEGWPSGTEWLSSAALLARIDTARRLGDAASAAAADAIVETAFDGTVPAALARRLRGLTSSDRVALVLASPEFQLA